MQLGTASPLIVHHAGMSRDTGIPGRTRRAIMVDFGGVLQVPGTEFWGDQGQG